MGALNNIEIEVPWPPSANHLFSTGRDRRRHLSTRGRRYRKAVRDAILEQHGLITTMTGELVITTHFWPPDRRRRDEDNLHKALRDSLTWSSLIADDCQFRESHNYMHDPIRGGRCVVTISGVEYG